MLIGSHMRVRDPARQERFYRDVLGMTDIRGGLGFSEEQMALKFEAGASTPYEPRPDAFYWKIGITLKNLAVAVEYLRGLGIEVSEPRQFRDIGYLCHLRDPEGFSIELLQQGFEGNHSDPGEGHPIAGQAILAHLTLRVADIDAAKALFGGTMGMRLMSVQPVPERQFTLYFYAWSDEPLPLPDLEAVENREWLWARPYTLLELQHLEGASALARLDPKEAGFQGFSYGRDAENEQLLSASDLSELG